MNIQILYNISPIVRSAFDGGFKLNFFFDEAGSLFCEHNPFKRYLIKSVIKAIQVCAISETIIYYVQTEDGLMGLVILSWWWPCEVD